MEQYIFHPPFFARNQAFPLKKRGGTIMDTTLFLARWLGLYFMAAALFIFLRRGEFPSFIREIEKNPFFLVFSGFTALFFGFAIVILHPEWSMDLKSLITIVGYWSILIGILRLFFPQVAIDFGKKVSSSETNMGIMAVVTGVIGLALLYVGFVQ
jgi:hypothetical protein